MNMHAVSGRPSRLWSVLAALLGITVLTAAAPAAGAAARVPSIDVIVSGSGASVAAAAHEIAAAGGRLLAPLPVVGGFAASVPQTLLPALAAGTGASVTPDGHVRVTDAGWTAAPYGIGSHNASAVGPQAVGADKAWATGDTGTGVTVALVDTGVDTTNPDLAGQVVGGVDFTTDHNPYTDPYGHGTFVAGVIAGTGAASSGAVRGVAPGAKLVSVKIADRSGATDVLKVLEAIQWAVSFKDTYGIKVLNLSLGTDSAQPWFLDPLNRAVEKAWQSGLVVTVAAGNGGAPGTVTKPGDDPWVITVGSFDDQTTPGNGDDTMSPFSSLGPTHDGIAKPDLVAPGSHVVSTRSAGSAVDLANPTAEVGSSYFRGSGTSFSAATAAGAAALVLAGNPTLTPDQVKYRLVSTAGHAPSTDRNAAGAGELDAFAATTSSSTAAANQGLATSTGIGSVQWSRGTLCIKDAAGNCMTDADANAVTGFTFDPASYFSSQWNSSQWSSSQWNSSQWSSSQWNTSQWYTSQWGSSQWNTTPTTSSQWNTSQWNTSQWFTSQWSTSQWASSQWSTSQWGSSQWGSSQWSSSQWSTSQWGSSQWGSSQWGSSQWGSSQWGSSQWAAAQWS